MPTKRRWALETARAMLGDVRARTERAVAEVEAIERRLEALAPGDRARAPHEAEIQECLQNWAHEMEALGVEVKGPWLVDFDNGRGYFCWRWPEDELAYYHDYEGGFASRSRIQ